MGSQDAERAESQDAGRAESHEAGQAQPRDAGQAQPRDAGQAQLRDTGLAPHFAARRARAATTAVRDATTAVRAAREELANALTHGLGIVLSVVGGSALVVLAALRGSAWELAGVAVFVATLLLLYAASTCYHTVRATRLRRRLQVLDHCAIYLLIAGTYTPFMLGPLRGTTGWLLLGTIWALAAGGVAFKLLWTGRFPRLSTGIYIGMGWIGGLAAVPLARELKTATLVWLVAGGVVYTAGTAFYHARRLPYAHSVWHLFVLTGSACHITAVAIQL